MSGARKAVSFLVGNALLAMAAGDMTRPPRSSEVTDATAKLWFEYAETFKNSQTSFPEHCAASFCRGIAVGIMGAKSVLFTSELDLLRVEIERLEAQIAIKTAKLQELQGVLDTYKKLVGQYGDMVTVREALTQGAITAVSGVTEQERELVTTLEQCDEVIAAMVRDFEAIDNKKLLSQYAQLAAASQQEKEKIERLTRELEGIQTKYPKVMQEFEENSKQFSHIKSRSMGSLDDLTQAARIISPSRQQQRGTYVGTPHRVSTAEVTS